MSTRALGLVVIAFGVVACSGGDTRAVTTGSSSPSTSTTVATSTTTTETTSTTTSTTVVVDTTTTVKRSVATAPAEPGPEADPCYMSNDSEACGPIRWTEPNRPLELSASAEPAVASVGEPVYFVLRLHDDDDAPNADCGGLFYIRDNQANWAEDRQCAAPCDPTAYTGMFGLWPTPPSTGGGDASATFGPVTFDQPGSYVMRISGSTEHQSCLTRYADRSVSPDWPAPHGSTGDILVTVEVV